MDEGCQVTYAVSSMGASEGGKAGRATEIWENRKRPGSHMSSDSGAWEEGKGLAEVKDIVERNLDGFAGLAANGSVMLGQKTWPRRGSG